MEGLLFWALVVGVTGWLAGKMIGEPGYGETLAGYADGLDIVFGIVGASIGGYLLFGTVSVDGGSFSRYATAIVGSVTLVGVARLVFARYLPFTSR